MNDTSSKWLQALATCMAGEKVTPQCFHGSERVGRPTREVQAMQIMFEPRLSLIDAVVMFDKRKLSEKFLLGEGWWVLSGSNKLADIYKFNRAMQRFSDDGITLFGAYGAALDEQKIEAADKLIKDEHCRQAVIGIWRRNPFSFGLTRDVPCTLTWQFLIRNGRLDMHVTMRSNDVWLGLPYDIFTTTCVQWYMCLLIRERGGPKLIPGRTYHTVASMHLYEDDMEKAAAVLSGLLAMMQFPTIESFPDFPNWDEVDHEPADNFYTIINHYAHSTLS